MPVLISLTLIQVSWTHEVYSWNRKSWTPLKSRDIYAFEGIVSNPHRFFLVHIIVSFIFFTFSSFFIFFHLFSSHLSESPHTRSRSCVRATLWAPALPSFASVRFSYSYSFFFLFLPLPSSSPSSSPLLSFLSFLPSSPYPISGLVLCRSVSGDITNQGKLRRLKENAAQLLDLYSKVLFDLFIVMVGCAAVWLVLVVRLSLLILLLGVKQYFG